MERRSGAFTSETVKLSLVGAASCVPRFTFISDVHVHKTHRGEADQRILGSSIQKAVAEAWMQFIKDECDVNMSIFSEISETIVARTV